MASDSGRWTGHQRRHVLPTHQLGSLGGIGTQPGIVQRRCDDDGGAFLIAGLVKLLHHRVRIGIDREHRKAHHPLARGRVCPAVPQAGDTERIATGQSDFPAHGLAGLVAGLIEVVDQHQAKLPLPPRGAVAGFFCGGLAAGVVGVATDLVVLGPCRDQAKPGQTASDPTRLVALDHDGGGKPGVRLLGEVCRQVNAKLFLHPWGALSGGEVGAHPSSLSLP